MRRLAPELVQQAEAAGLDAIYWKPDLRSLIEDLADKRLKYLQVVSDLEFVDEIPPLGKEDALSEAAIDVTRGHLSELELEPNPRMRYGYPELRRDLEVPTEVEDVTVEHVEIEFAACHLVDASYEDAELWNVRVRANLGLTGFARKSDWIAVDEAPNFRVEDGDWNDHMMWVGGSVDVEVDVSVLIDSSLNVLGTDVESVEAA